MELQTHRDAQRTAAISFDNQECTRIAAKAAVNDTALDKLRAMPLLLSEALTNQADEFFAAIAPLLDGRRDAELGNALRKMRDDYANEQVETLADEAGITVNHAITRLRRAFA